jgi:hypothetical protein
LTQPLDSLSTALDDLFWSFLCHFEVYPRLTRLTLSHLTLLAYFFLSGLHFARLPTGLTLTCRRRDVRSLERLTATSRSPPPSSPTRSTLQSFWNQSGGSSSTHGCRDWQGRGSLLWVLDTTTAGLFAHSLIREPHVIKCTIIIFTKSASLHFLCFYSLLNVVSTKSSSLRMFPDFTLPIP